MELTHVNQRDDCVTIAKVIGIVCVVMAHAMNPAWITWKVIYTFHMPLFFLLSGYCFKEKYLDDAKSFVLRKLKGIYMPFVVYSIIFLLLHNVFAKCHIYDTTWIYGWKDYIWHISKIITRMSHNESLLGMFWFLKELFWGNMFFYGLLRLSKGKKWMPVIILAFLTILLTITEWSVPYFTISKTTIYASFFISIGYAGRMYLESLNHWWMWGVSVLIIAAYVWVGKNISIGSQDIYTILPYTFTAILGSAFVMNLSRRISANGGGQIWLVQFAGNHTLEIMALHFITFKLVSYGIIMRYGLSIIRLEDFPIMMDFSVRGWWIAYTIMGIVVPTGFAYVKEKFQKICLIKKKF